MKEPTPTLPAYQQNRYQDPVLQQQYVCLGHKIAMIRRSLGISQRQLSTFVGISRSYLSKLEQGPGLGGVSLEVLYKISYCLNLSISQLLRLRVQDYRLCNKHLSEQYERTEFFKLAQARFLERTRLW